MSYIEIELEEMQKIEFDILCYFKMICEKHELRYYLGYGTLLGAVRHSGFIPWDDDIDVIMPRADYLKLIEIMCKEKHPYYKLVSRETVPQFTAPLPKIIDTRTELEQNYCFIEKVPLGVYLDIFILDGAGDSLQEARETFGYAIDLYKKWADADRRMFVPGDNVLVSFLRWLKRLPTKVKGITYRIDALNAFSKQKGFDDSEYVGIYNVGFTEFNRCVWRREVFGEGVYQEFMGELFKVPADFDACLHSLYGEYMKLPPESERITHHKYSLQWKEKEQK